MNLEQTPTIEIIQELITSKKYSAESLLQKCIDENANLKWIELIIQNGVTLNFENGKFNFLYDACVLKNVQAVELLLKAGVNPNKKAVSDGENFLEWIIWEQLYIKDYLNEDNTYLIQIERLLIKYGAESLN